MVASRNRPKGCRTAPFGLGLLVFGLMPTSIGHQDVLSLLIRQPEVTQRARAHALSSTFSTIHVATFSLPRPIGTLIPEFPGRLAHFDPDITGSIVRDDPIGIGTSRFTTINRRLKGGSLAPREKPEPETGPSRYLTPGRVKTVSFPRPADVPSMIELPVAADIAPKLDEASTPGPEALEELVPQANLRTEPIADDNPATQLATLYFSNPPAGIQLSSLQPWPAEHDLIMQPSMQDSAAIPAATTSAARMVAPKGQVTGPSQRPKSPAERLGLDTKARAKAEKCLAEAVYFESRGEPKRGQIAVAQVVMNRVFSGYYPNDVCDVVYQNKHRYNACQFTFACDSVKDVVNDPPLWKQAMEIARDTLDGHLWLHDIGKSTHYHAYWVSPWWVGTMRKLSRIGVHTFYRPKRWGDGTDEPVWGPGATAQQAKVTGS